MTDDSVRVKWTCVCTNPREGIASMTNKQKVSYEKGKPRSRDPSRP
jgi:hypothetical protein